MFWYTTQKDYVTAVLSLTKIARFNGIVFEDIFREARDFLRGKRSKGIQCDFQPLLRLGQFVIFNFFFLYFFIFQRILNYWVQNIQILIWLIYKPQLVKKRLYPNVLHKS